MIEALSILKDTPIPTLMVLGGIALLVLSVATRISDKIEVSPERQKGAWTAGLILVVIGSALFLIQPGANGEPSPTPVPTASPQVVVCASDPAHFAGHWQSRISQLGCPENTQGGEMLITRQVFERGVMIDREDTALIYALLNDGSYLKLGNTWTPGQPEYSCPDISPDETPPTPRNGFGKAWCNNEALRARIGFASQTEERLEGVWQEFESGALFEVFGDLYLLDEEAQTWEKLN